MFEAQYKYIISNFADNCWKNGAQDQLQCHLLNKRLYLLGTQFQT